MEAEKTHLMLDFETLGIESRSVVLSLGVVVFTAKTVFDTQIWHFDPAYQIKKGRQIDWSTLSWWLNQGQDAKQVFSNCNTEGIGLDRFANEFNVWAQRWVDLNTLVWSNGATFDIPILRSLLLSERAVVPWKYTNERCYRTVKQMHQIEAGEKRAGVKHNALDDSRFQATCLQKLLMAHREYEK